MKKVIFGIVIIYLIHAFMANVVYAASMNEVEGYLNRTSSAADYEYSESDEVVVQGNGYALFRKDMGMSCPIGQLFFVDQRARSYFEVKVKTCDDRVKWIMSADTLIGKMGKSMIYVYKFR